MDPRATVSNWLSQDSMRENARNYRDWTINGGFRVRVAIAAHTDAWMMGDRYGTVEALSAKYAYVTGDSGKRYKFAPSGIAGTV